MSKARLWLVLSFLFPFEAQAETIYAAWTELGPFLPNRLTRFESETPWLQEEILLDGPVPMLTLAFDPTTGTIYGFDAANCQITCPPYLDPVAIDPVAGTSTFVHLPGLTTGWMNKFDTDFEPRSRDFRFFSPYGESYRYSLDTLQVYEDLPLDPLFEVAAVAHRWPVPGSAGFETYAIGHFPQGLGQAAPPGRTPDGSWASLARIGGPGGDPPPSSGEVTWIGPVDIEAERLGFDIAADGTAYLAVFNSFWHKGAENELFTIDLETGALHALGVIVPPSSTSYLTGIVILSGEAGESILEIPTFSRFGIALFAMALAGVGAVVAAKR